MTITGDETATDFVGVVRGLREGATRGGLIVTSMPDATSMTMEGA